MSSGRAGRALSVVVLTSARAWRGSGVSLAQIAQGLAARGHVPHIVAGDTPVVAGFHALGLPASRVGTARTGLAEAAALRRVLAAVDADVVLADRPRDLRLATLATAGRRAGIVYRYNLSRRTPSADLLTRFGYRRARLVVFLSEASARAARSASPPLARAPWRVIPNGVDTDRHRPDPGAAARFRRVHALGEGPLLVTIGSLTAEKRHELLLDVVARLQGAATLAVCGAGPRRAELAASAAASRLPVRFLDALPPDGIRGACAAATVVVHACAVETFGRSVLEAMACGAPVVAPASGALPEVVGDSGILVPPDPETFPAQAAAAVQALLADAAARVELGAAARRRAIEHFPVDRMQNGYAEAIEAAAPAGGLLRS